MNEIIPKLKQMIIDLTEVSRDMVEFNTFISIRFPNLPNQIIFETSRAISSINNIVKLLEKR